MITYGLLDDYAPGTGAVLPTTRDQILNLRRACECAIWKDKSLSWVPLDKSKWYYTSTIVSAEDDRFTIPASLCFLLSNGATAGDGYGFIDVQYVIEFAGAVLTASTSLSATQSTVPGTPRLKDEVPGYVSIAKPLLSFRR
jgi:hypothetical protein